MDRTSTTYLIVAIAFAVCLQLVMAWRLRRSLGHTHDPVSPSDEDRTDGSG